MPGQVLSPLEQAALDRAKVNVRQEMPDVADAPIEPMGLFDRLVKMAREKMIGGGGSTIALAHSGNGGSVAYEPTNMVQLGPAGMEDTLAHELQHVRQARSDYKGKSLMDRARQFFQDRAESRLPYGQQPAELEAFQVENDRAVRQGRQPGITPNFSGPGFRETGDITLDPPDVQALMEKGYTRGEALMRAAKARQGK